MLFNRKLFKDLVMSSKSPDSTCKMDSLSIMPLMSNFQTSLDATKAFETKGGKVADEQKLVDLR